MSISVRLRAVYLQRVKCRRCSGLLTLSKVNLAANVAALTGSGMEEGISLTFSVLLPAFCHPVLMRQTYRNPYMTEARASRTSVVYKIKRSG